MELCVVRENGLVRCFRWIVLTTIGILSVGACTSRDIYEARQQDAHNACLRNPSAVERDKCLSRTSQSYDEFTREREKVQQDQE
jgi:hypothetical protein